MKNEKNYMGFLIIKNIANFEAFWWDKNFSKNLLFLGNAMEVKKNSKGGKTFFFTLQASLSPLH